MYSGRISMIFIPSSPFSGPHLLCGICRKEEICFIKCKKITMIAKFFWIGLRVASKGLQPYNSWLRTVQILKQLIMLCGGCPSFWHLSIFHRNISGISWYTLHSEPFQSNFLALFTTKCQFSLNLYIFILYCFIFTHQPANEGLLAEA